MYERILVAVDGSENSKRAAMWAVDLARREGSSLFVISVVPTSTYSDAAGPGSVAAPVKGFMDRARTKAESYVRDIVTAANANGTKVRGEIIENVPSIPQSITDYADEWKVQLVVVGTRGLSGFKKLLLGSVSSALVSHSPCSVLVVR